MQGYNATAVPAGASDTVVKASPGTLRRLIVTATGANPIAIWDNASGHTGTQVGALPASPALGPYEFDVQCKNGIVVQGSATNPAVTVIWD
jgi:hypothetical protein